MADGFERRAFPFGKDAMRRGSATVEYAMVFSLVLLIVGLALQAAMLQHERSVLQAVVADAAAGMAVAWTSAGAEPSNGSQAGEASDGTEMGPDMYWQVSALLGAGAGVEAGLEKTLAGRLAERRWMPGSGLGTPVAGDMLVHVSYAGGFPFAVLRVTASVPVGGLMAGWARRLGLGTDFLRIRAETEVVVLSPRTVIQDMDQGLQLLQGTDAAKRVGGFARTLGRVLAKMAAWTGE